MGRRSPVAVAVFALTTVAWTGLGTPLAVAAPPTATVLGGAVSGGNVIVKLADQHTGGQLNALTGSRKAAVGADQSPLIARMTAAGATHVRGLVGVSAIAANVSADEVSQLSRDPDVQEIVPDLAASPTPPAPHGAPAKLNPALCRSNPGKPVLEPEALSVLHVETDAKNDPDQAALIATGKNVTVGVLGADSVAGNPNFVRPGGSQVVRNAPQPNRAATSNEIYGGVYGDASAVAAQGTVTYDYATELPHSGLPGSCTFRVKGVAPDASLVDTLDLPGYGTAGGPTSITLSDILAGIDNAVLTGHAGVIAESYAMADVQLGGLLTTENDAAVAAGVTVLAAADDKGAASDDSPASDPNVIGVGTTNALRVLSQADGYSGWTDNDIAPFSASSAAQNDKLVDLVAPGYAATIASDAPSQSTPLAAGVAADVIQSYADSHGGHKPTPAMVKQILVGTAQDLGAPADQQGSGMIDAYAAVRAAQQEPNARPLPTSDSASLIPSQTQLDVTGAGGSQSTQNISLYNTGDSPTQVTGTLRSLAPATQIGSTVTEPVSAPASGQAVPAQGAAAATPIQFTVPAGVDRLDADMIWPDPTNSSILSFTLVDPHGKLTQISADYGSDAAHKVSNSQHAEVTAPAAGSWTARIRWANGRADLENPPNVPGKYTGNLSFTVSGQQFVTASAGNAITVPAHGSATFPIPVALPTEPGDHPESLQLSADNGRTVSIPVARRTLIPSTGGTFNAQLTGSIGFPGTVDEVRSFDIDVPAGHKSLDVSLSTADASTDNIIRYMLVDPQGNLATQDATPTTTAAQSFGPGAPVGRASLTALNPVAGRWRVDVFLAQTVSGHEFTQTVTGTVRYDQGQPTGRAPVGTGGCANIQAPTRAAVTAIEFACDQIGLPYQWGGNGPAHGDAGFDCSGLTTAAYQAAGVPLPRTAQTQYNAGPLLPLGQPLQPGDLVFYGTPGHVHHVALYIGAGTMVQAPDFGRPIQISSYRWPGDDYLGASRPALR